eukprot:s1183_g5.t1
MSGINPAILKLMESEKPQAGTGRQKDAMHRQKFATFLKGVEMEPRMKEQAEPFPKKLQTTDVQQVEDGSSGEKVAETQQELLCEESLQAEFQQAGPSSDCDMLPDPPMPSMEDPSPADASRPQASTAALPRLQRRKAKPLLPVMRSTKAFSHMSSLKLPAVHDFFAASLKPAVLEAMTCRTHNPHETQFHMEARIGFRRPRLAPSQRLRPLPAQGESHSASLPNLKALPWKLGKYAPSSQEDQRTAPGLSDSKYTSWSVEAEESVAEEVIDLVLDEDALAADTVGKVVQDACYFEAGRSSRPASKAPRTQVHVRLFIVPPEVPADAVNFMQLCLMKDPNYRPSAAELGQHPWLKGAGGIIQQVDDDALKSTLVGRGPCTVAGSRRFGPKVSQSPPYVRELKGDQAEGVEFLRSDDDPSWRMSEEDVPVGTAMKAAEDFQKCCQKRVATRRTLQRPVGSCPKTSEEEPASKDAPETSQELKAEACSKPPETTKKVCIKTAETAKKANLPKPRAPRSALKAAAKVAARETSKQELQALELKADEKSGGRAPPIPASLQDKAVLLRPGPLARTRRYTTGLLSLMLRAYAKCGRPPPLLCPCIPRPEGPAPTLGSDGNVVLSKAWEAYIQKIADYAENHAENLGRSPIVLNAGRAQRNCEFATGHTSLQKQVLSLIQSAKQ